MDLTKIAKNTGAYGDINQNNEELVITFNRLLRLTNMLVEIMGDFLIEIGISPADIIQKKVEDVRQIQFFLIWNLSYKNEFAQKRQLCEETIKALIADEFEYITEVIPSQYFTSIDWTTPVLTISSVVKYLDNSAVTVLDAQTLAEILENDKYQISIPTSLPYQYKTVIFMHSDSIIGIIDMEDYINSLQESGASVALIGKDKKKTRFVVIPILGLNSLQYDIPYVQITKNHEIVKDFFQ